MSRPPLLLRRSLLAIAALAPAGCGIVTVGGPGSGPGNPNSSGATVAHLQRIVDEALQPKKAELEAKGQEVGEMWDSGVCRGAGVSDPAGNRILLHHRYMPYES